MGYFGGLGAGKGWNSFKFILTPSEFEKIFDDLNYSFIETGARVSIDYTESPKPSIFDGYQVFFDQILTNSDSDILDKKAKWDIESQIRISIIDDIHKILFVNIENENEMPEFKRVEPLEAVININPFYLMFNKKTLSVTYMHQEGIIGLELNYPKVITRWDEEHKATTHDTISYKTNELYDILVKRVKAISKKAKLKKNEDLYKPNFWISESSKEAISKNKFLKKNDLIII